MKYPIKFLDDAELTIGGYGVVWGDEATKDLTGEYFTQETDLGLKWYDERPLLYHHGLDDVVQMDVIGRATKMTPDEVGVWVESQLDRRNSWYTVVKQMVKAGALNYSSGSIAHLAVKELDGHIKRWPIVEMTVTPVPAEPRFTDLDFVKSAYKSIGLNFELPEGDFEGGDSKDASAHETGKSFSQGENEMTEEFTAEQLKAIGGVVAGVFDARDAAVKATADREAEIEAEVKLRLEAAGKEKDEAATKTLPTDEDEADPKKKEITGIKDLRYGHLSAADLAMVGMALSSKGEQLSEEGMKALVAKTGEAAEGKPHALPYDNKESYQLGAYKALVELQGDELPIKADEIHYPTLSSYGDEWVGVAYGSNLWEAIRIGTFLVPKMPTIEVPAGHESIWLPLEGGDPTWYLVAAATDVATVDHGPSATITSSQIGTSRKQLTLAKLGCRALWAGEMSEDSLIPFAGQLRSQFEVSGQEILEAVILNGDLEASANKNINDIAGTPAASDYFMAFDGMRKSPLVTTTANSRDGGVLIATDYLETVKLMGNAGKNALDRSKVEFIVDPLTHYKSLELPEVKTRDVSASPTVEGGRLTGLWGYGINISGQIAYRAGNLLSNSAGKVDQDTVANNAYGQILAVRYDQWRLAFRRRMTMESTRIARADTTELVAMVRLGLAQRDTEAAAISYNLTV